MCLCCVLVFYGVLKLTIAMSETDKPPEKDPGKIILYFLKEATAPALFLPVILSN